MRWYVFIAVLLLLLGSGYWLLFLRSPKAPGNMDKLYYNSLNEVVDSLLITKKSRCLTVYAHGKPVKKYHISLGSEPVGAKQFEGDGKTPEGRYKINVKNNESTYHLSLGISYPSTTDKLYARQHNKAPGGDIMIHGVPNGKEKLTPVFARADWTAGCIALTNKDIDELYKYVAINTPVRIVP